MGDSFDVDAFLHRPLVGRIATSGPRVLPVWYVWEEASFWVLTGPWSRLARSLGEDPAATMVVDSCDLVTGETLQVIATGTAEIVDFEVARGRRMLSRYLGPDIDGWDARFRAYVTEPIIEGTVWVRLRPDRVVARDQSFHPATAAPPTAGSSALGAFSTGLSGPPPARRPER